MTDNRDMVCRGGWVLRKQVSVGSESPLNGIPPVVADEAPHPSDNNRGKVKLPKP